MREGEEKLGRGSCTSELNIKSLQIWAILCKSIFWQWAGVQSASTICQAPHLFLSPVAIILAGRGSLKIFYLLTSSTRPCLVTHATVAVKEGGARPVHCPFCGWGIHRQRAHKRKPTGQSWMQHWWESSWRRRCGRFTTIDCSQRPFEACLELFGDKS